MLKKIILYFKKKINPKQYAKMIGIDFGLNCRFVGQIEWGSEPYLIKIGNHVSITRSSFITHDGGVWVFRESDPDIDIVKPIRIGNNVFIGSNSVILPGIIIEDNVVVGAGSIVTKNLPENSVYAGVPARRIGSIDEYKIKCKKYSLNTKRMNKEKKRQILLEYWKDWLE